MFAAVGGGIEEEGSLMARARSDLIVPRMTFCVTLQSCFSPSIPVSQTFLNRYCALVLVDALLFNRCRRTADPPFTPLVPFDGVVILKPNSHAPLQRLKRYHATTASEA